MRKGYGAEYQVKQMLERMWGKGYVIKSASSRNIPDFIILGKKLAYEVKSTTRKKLILHKRDKEQYKRFLEWRNKTKSDIKYIIIFRKKPKNRIEILTIDEFGEKYVKAKRKEDAHRNGH